MRDKLARQHYTSIPDEKRRAVQIQASKAVYDEFQRIHERQDRIERMSEQHSMMLEDHRRFMSRLDDRLTLTLEELKSGIASLDRQLSESLADKRTPFPTTLVSLHQNFINERFKGKCPVCDGPEILGHDGRLDTSLGHKEHFYDKNDVRVESTWMICTSCHDAKTFRREGWRERLDAAFARYVAELRVWLRTSPGQLTLASDGKPLLPG